MNKVGETKILCPKFLHILIIKVVWFWQNNGYIDQCKIMKSQENKPTEKHPTDYL